MKYLVSSAVVFVLVILPFGSWYYLQSGYDFRKKALVALESKGEVPFMSVTGDESQDSFTMVDVLRHKTSLVKFCDSDVIEEDVEIYEQFKNAYTFQLVQINLDGCKSRDNSWNSYNYSSGDPGGGYWLVDTLGQLRNTYDASPAAMKDMVQHLAILLPQRKAKDIKIKKDESR